MGYSMMVYVGAYLKVTDTPMVTREGPLGCVTEGCPRNGSSVAGTYCSSCGKPLGRKELLFSQYPSDLISVELEDELSFVDVGVDIGIGNKRKPLPDHLEIGEPPFAVDLDTVDVRDFGDNFYENYSDIIGILQKKATVEVKVGVVAYYL